MKRSTFRKPDSVPKRMKSKQLAVTAQEKELWSRLASEVGCVACMLDGRFNDHVSIHHVDGRTKPDCHKNVLPLCAPHHQDDGSGAISVHPWKARFEKRYGVQDNLVDLCRKLLGVGDA
mgnify:CR=1 FL=1